MTRVDRLLAWLVVTGVVLLAACLMTPAARAQSVTRLCFPPANPVGNSCITVDAANPLPVIALVSVSGFAPATTGTPITASVSPGATGTLPAGTVVVATNVGTTNGAYCKLGASVTTSDQYIAPNGGWFAFTVGAATQLTCLTNTGTTTVNMVGGAGLPTGTGGGGGGSGGAVTMASGAVASGAFASGSIGSGASVDLGAQADTACATDNGTCSEIALVKRNNQRLTTLNTTLGTPLQAGGTVTANLGTLNGAATAANQATEISSLATIASNTGAAIPAGTAAIGTVGQTGMAYETVAASQTGQALGATGATGDYLSHCVIYPTSTTPGVVTVFDNASSAAANVIAFPGGASSVSNLAPISIPVGALSTAGAWKVTTGANLVVTCYGRFT